MKKILTFTSLNSNHPLSTHSGLFFPFSKTKVLSTLNQPSQSRFFIEHIKPHPIPELPVLNALREKAQFLPIINLKKAALVSIQHNLESTPSLYQQLIKLGLPANNIYASGKWYSDNVQVIERIKKMGIHYIDSPAPSNITQYRDCNRRKMEKIWLTCHDDIKKKQIDTLLVLDEGGRLLESMPYELRLTCKTAGIEQTKAGLFNTNSHFVPFPIINIADSFAKRDLESPLIADAIWQHIHTLIHTDSNLKSATVFGVIGNGAIGSNVVKNLLAQGHFVLIYDEKESAFNIGTFKRLFRMSSIQGVILNSEVILGCTGKDITQHLDIKSIAMNKTFISCTSEDKEFFSLLKFIASESNQIYPPFSDINYKLGGNVSIKIIRGGFPVNFDKSPISVPTQDIQLTRGLLFGGILQALTVVKKPMGNGWAINHPVLFSLDPHIQKFVVDIWRKFQPEKRYPKPLLDSFQDIDWIKNKSGGVYQENPIFKQIFSIPSPPHPQPRPSFNMQYRP